MLSDQQLANLYSKLEQLNIQIGAAEQNLARAGEAGHTKAETRTIRAEIGRLNKARQGVHDRLAADAKERREAEEPPGSKSRNTSQSGPTGGSGMSLQEVRAGIAAANEKLNEALGAVNQAHDAAEEAQGMFITATEGSGQGDVTSAVSMVAQSVNDLEAVRGYISAAMSEAEGVANRL